MAALYVETVTTPEGLRGLAADYERLLHASAAVDGVPGLPQQVLPFVLHEWHTSWWRAFRKDELSIRDSLFVKRVMDGATCVGLAPFVLTERPSVGPVRVCSMALLGADPYITELRTVLVEPARGREVARALSDHLRKDDRWDWLHWSGLVRGTPFADEIFRTANLYGLPTVPDFVLDLAPTWDDFKKSLKRNIRESLRHCYNSLKRDGHEMELEVAETPESIAALLETFHGLHGARADLTDTVEHPNRFAGGASKRFLADVMHHLAKKGAAKIFALKVAGAVVAVRIGFVVERSLYLYYSGFDPAWRKYSVMTTCVAEALKWAIEARLVSANLSAGRDVSKTRWGAREVAYDEAVQVQRRPRSRVAYAAYTKAFELRGDPRLQGLIGRLLPRRTYE
jgi:CelD/BcsL family acetyltransferase involved in cellulose biosynthesis